jgi:hypothetical protein
VDARSGGRAGAPDFLWILLALAGGLGLFLLREQQIADASGAISFPLDDSWIHLHFARNLAEGRGFSYNPGVPVAGSTAPLWTLLLGGVFALLGSHPVWAKVLGALAALGAAAAARGLAAEWTRSRGWALAGGLATALAGPLVWGALSAMEVSLAALLVTAALLAHASGRHWLTALLSGLAALARPEAVLLVPLIWLAGPLTLRRAASLLGVPAALLVPWVAFNLATVGSPLPATAAAKIEGGLVGVLSGAREPAALTLLWRPWAFLQEWAVWLAGVNPLLPLLIPVGLWALGRASGRRALAPAAVLLVHPIGMALLAPYRGPGFQEGRYSIHLLPLAIVVAVLALFSLTRTLSLRGRGQGAGLRRAAAPAMAALLLAGSLWSLWPAAGRYAWAVQNINAMQVHLGRWVAAHTPPQARLALNDVGAIAWVSRREVVDVMGLVTPAIIPYRRDGELGVLRYLERACPDYLIIFPAWFPALAGMRDRFIPVYRVRLEHNTVAGADEMVVYETPWNRWRPGGQPCAGR